MREKKDGDLFEFPYMRVDSTVLKKTTYMYCTGTLLLLFLLLLCAVRDTPEKSLCANFLRPAYYVH